MNVIAFLSQKAKSGDINRRRQVNAEVSLGPHGAKQSVKGALKGAGQTTQSHILPPCDAKAV